MFCPDCGSELREGAAFCSECGAKVAEVNADASVNANAKAGSSANGPVNVQATVSDEASYEVVDDGVDGVIDSSSSKRTLKDEVRFAKNLKEPITEIPVSPSTGNELGDELTRFANIYDVSVANYLALLEAMEAKLNLEQCGPQWYYENAADPLIEASRQINADIAATEDLLRATRAQIAQNERARLEAANNRDAEKARSHAAANKTKKRTGWKFGCLAVVIAYFVFAAIGVAVMGGSAGNSQTFLVGIVFAVACIGALVWYYKVGKNRVKNAKTLANVRSSEADMRFAQIMEELAAKDAELLAQCSQIEAKILELTPIAGEIRFKANERAEFLYTVEMLELNELLQRLATVAASQTQMLRDMGTIPDEDEWFEARHLAKIVISGRADTLKEALQLLDTSNYREADLKIKGEMLEAQGVTNKVLAMGFSEMISTQQKTIEVIRSGFDEVKETMDLQHAQEMIMLGKIAHDQAKAVKLAAEGNDIAREGNRIMQEGNEYVQEGNETSKKFYNTVAEKRGWKERF